MRRRLIIAAAAAVLVLAGPSVLAQTVVGTPHDLSSAGPGATSNSAQVCVFCHTPHNSRSIGSPNRAPLWNHNASTATGDYGVYASDTLNASPTAVAANDTSPNGYGPGLCMSCHDGTVSVFSVQNAPNDDDPVSTNGAASHVLASGILDGAWDGNLGSSSTALANDHPIGFAYNAALVTEDVGGLNDPTVAPISDWLGSNGIMECDTCHDPHDGTNGTFLRASVDASAICTTCHQK